MEEEINKFQRRQKWGRVEHVDVAEEEKITENDRWQGEREDYTMSLLRKGFSNFCHLFFYVHPVRS